jgi:hypothetical protein
MCQFWTKCVLSALASADKMVVPFVQCRAVFVDRLVENPFCALNIKVRCFRLLSLGQSSFLLGIIFCNLERQSTINGGLFGSILHGRCPFTRLVPAWSPSSSAVIFATNDRA